MIDTLFTGRHLVHLDKTASTNTYAKNYIANNSPIDGTVILTDEQTAGRGQGSNTWHSEPGKNITLSIIYATTFLPSSRQFELNMAVSTGLVNALKTIYPSEGWKIKWPNDILCNGKKVGGLLIENIIRGHMLQYSVIGIGLNINQLDFSSELINATSISALSGRSFQLDDVLGSALQGIESQYLQLKSGVDLRVKYLGNLYRLGEEANYSDNSGVFTGIIKDVGTDGRLIVMKNGQLIHFNFQQLKFL